MSSSAAYSPAQFRQSPQSTPVAIQNIGNNVTKEVNKHGGIWYLIVIILAITLFTMVVLWILAPKIVQSPNGSVNLFKNFGVSLVFTFVVVLIIWIIGTFSGRAY